MITTPTVFILGAGASWDYGFPLGRDLIRDIILNRNVHRTIEGVGFTPEERQRFVEALRQARSISIDHFLSDRRDDFLEIGKAAIAASLIPRENSNTIDDPEFFSDGREDWYRTLFGLMRGSSPDTFVNNKVSFITFNYDRSLDYALFTHIRSQFGMATSDTVAILNQLRIVHVHGQLGELHAIRGNGRTYEPVLSPAEVKLAMQGIGILFEVNTESQALDDARELIGDANQIVFLGFGYDESNMDLLQLRNIKSGCRVFGTCVGETRARRDRIVDRFPVRTPSPPDGASPETTRIFLEEPSWDTNEVLRQRENWLLESPRQ